ncbi:B3 domain-containing transcription factor NGA1 [Amborella trichopoda]|uniref:TF-B3 domain-containing protein n=1 Tax=Amborella trichopoda TaxID=13333 RepID=W1NPW3_AMBTC|nr:B3 domain-containing transcription factor NGA1 [Amborella trichopoda]ERM98946.1 hypothetical protein AMTR_s00114p00142630 [Amborella trichopoda]|eukprot:XP_006836093.1 B3 domain-containing transcription factor NGA1 [Amborella trichopoda]
MEEEREHMFDKPLTPSDVGKLNRLVIPKQHAEKYFPLDQTSNEKGLLLGFEDNSGKPWRFRYSYWNSSQSYVLTKGWSRFVKEKQLCAGDIVSFSRHSGKLFIAFKHRANLSPQIPLWHRNLNNIHATSSINGADSIDNGGVGYNYNGVLWCSRPNGSLYYVRVPSHGGEMSSGNGVKRVRLFGVDLECPEVEETDSVGVTGAWPAPQLFSNVGLVPRAPLEREREQTISFDLEQMPGSQWG